MATNRVSWETDDVPDMVASIEIILDDLQKHAAKETVRADEAEGRVEELQRDVEELKDQVRERDQRIAELEQERE